MNIEKKFEALFPEETRNEEVTKILGYVKEGNFCQVIGLPGVGRSNLVGLLAYNRRLREAYFGNQEPLYHFISVNFTNIQDTKGSSVLRLMYLSLVDSFRERGRNDISEELLLLLEDHNAEDELLLFQKLKQAISIVVYEKKIKLIFLFDHFEEYVGSMSKTFFGQLRSLQEHARYYFSVVFFLHRPVEALVDADLLPVAERLVAGREIYLRVDDPILTTFLLSFLETTLHKGIPRDVKNMLLEKTSGHPQLLKTALEETIHADVPLDVLPKMLADNRAIRSVLYDIWGSFHPQEQSFLRKLSVSETVDLDLEINQNMLEFFSRLGVVKNLQISIPLFADFVRYREEHKLDEKITLDDATEKIHIGDSDLSEKLTGTEFALLVYLLRHPDSIVSRDELVAAAWGDLKSTAGVTDQAIDQLIYRIRQKIEENPRMPYHLVTVKGRGYRFLP